MQQIRYRAAIPFIIKNELKNCYELTKQAQELLKSIDKNISVVTVAGLYRTGKSYLLNSVILDKKSIFGVGPTVNACTKGLWLWVQPDPSTEKRSMLVIDTQGLGALDEEATHDMKIFCLAVLLSTTFIYNSVGSIDENALQTLSLVLNLVNSIDQQHNSCRPQFIWVVRDFTLQLIDQKGKVLTPQQYLQMALALNSKQQQKTSIRKTIASAFVQRDCFTLVKPLIDQTKLQNLDKIPMDELRPEFVSQSIQLRNKIKSTLKQFQLTSSKNNITGKQYVMVIHKYLHALNNGAVPNMLDTWSFIKQQKSRQALEQIRKIYTEKIKSKIASKIPMKKIFLEELFKSLKEQAKNLYLKMTYDQSSTSSVQQLFANALLQAQKINTQQNKLQIKAMLNKQFEPFIKKLYSQYYNSYQQYETEINKNFRDSLIQKNFDRIDDIRENVERYTQQKLTENLRYFEKKLKQQLKTLKSTKDQIQTSLTKQITEVTDQKQKQRKGYHDKIFGLQKTIRVYQNERQQFIQFTKTQKQLIQSNIQFLKKKNQQLNHIIDDQNKQIHHLQHIQNELKQKYFIQHKQYQKQRALFIQKQQYMNTRIKQLQSKIHDYQSKMNQTGGKFQLEKKGITKIYQQKIQNSDQQNKKLTQKIIQLQTKLSKSLQQTRQLIEQIQHIKKNNITQHKKLQQKIIQVQSNKKQSKIQQQLKQQNQQLSLQINRLNQKYNQQSKKYKILHQELKTLQNNSQKQIAIHIQQIQFQQLQINDMKTRYDQLKKSYQNALQNLHGNTKNQQNNLQLKIYQLTTQHQKFIKQIQLDNQQKIKSFKKQINMLQKHKQQLTLQQSLDKKTLQSKQKQWKQSTNMFQTMIKKLEQKLQSSQKDYQDISKQKQSFYSFRIKQLQQQTEQIKQKSSQQIAQNSKKSEQAFSVLKHYSQIQKQQWQKRLSQQKQRSEKRVKQTRQQLQKKHTEQRTTLQQQLTELQNRLIHLERLYNQKLQNLQYDHDILLQKLTNQYMEEKSQLNKQIALQLQKNQFFKNQINNKIQFYQMTIENVKINLKQQFQDNLKKISQQKDVLQQKFDSIKKTNRQLQQNNLILKSQADKQKAVFKQKQKSMQKKIIQLQNRLQAQLANYNKTIESINQRHGIQIQKLNQQIDKLNLNVTALQEQRDKLQTQHENNINRLQAKLKVVEQSKNKNKQDYQDIVNKFQCAVSHFGNQKKKLLHEKQKGLQDVNQKANQCIKQIEQGHKKMLKENQDRISRLVTQNKSLKQRIMIIQLQKSNHNSTIKKNYFEENEKQKIDKKYQKRIQQYKQLYQKQKQKCKKIKDQHHRLKQQMQSTSGFTQGHSTLAYFQRPSISQISSSRLYNCTNNNLNATQSKRKYTNTPASTQRGKSKADEYADYSGIMRGNQTNVYKNRE